MGKNEKLIRVYSLIVTGGIFGLAVYLFTIFNSANPDFQFVERLQWVKDFNIFYQVGVDGISILMVMLTAFIFPVTILGIWNSVNSEGKGILFPPAAADGKFIRCISFT